MSSQPVEPLGPSGYEWPPLPILDPEAAAAILAQRLQDAYDDLEAQRLGLIAAAVTGQTQVVGRWLEDFQAGINTLLAASAQNVAAYLALHLGPRYQEGAEFAAGGTMTWNTAHVAALTSLAIDTYDDFLQRAEQAAQVSEAFAAAVRQAAREEIPKIAAGGRTARQIGRRLEAKLLTRYGIDTVTYRDGSRVPVKVYAEMAARTKSGVAYNSGSLNEWHQAGVTYVEVFDGLECGWSSHDDVDKANGTIRTVRDAAGHMLGHPNCRRGFGARPDITTREQAENAEPSTTEEQRADQAVHEPAPTRATSPRSRAAQLRRAALAARRQARLLGVSTPEDAQAVIARVLRERGLT